MTRSEIESIAEETLRENNVYSVPVDIDRLVKRLNLTKEETEFGEDISGVLVVKNQQGAIGYNSTHPLVRQRFTIAHEIAHFLVHVRNNQSQLFIDRYIAWRDPSSSTGNDHEEVEANRLGAALLMPGKLVREQIEKNGLDLDDESDISSLAGIFKVSAAAMTNRLISLRLLR